MDFFEDEDDYFGEYNDYFGFKGDEISREAKDKNCNALYRPGNIFSSIKPHSEYMNLEQERKYGPQSYSFPPFSVRHETTGYKKPAVGPAAYPLEGSHKASIGHSSPRQMPPEMPCSVIAQHIDSNLFQDEAPVSLTSDMFQLPDFLETDTQSAKWEKKNTPQWKQEKNHEKSQLLFLQPGKSSGKMNSRDFMEVYKIRRPSRSNDQHIKVVTSRGPRDRRMRLSIQTAIKFFDVQDRLGFDQPSKAVEWLIQNSRSAIDQLPAIPPSSLEKSSHVNSNPDSLLPFLHRDTESTKADFVTGCEENIGIADSLSPSLLTEPSILKRQSRSQVIKTDHPRKKSVKTAVGKCTGTRRDSTSLKDIRFKARERARERTKEKRYTGGRGTFASPHMNHIAALEIEALTLRENTASVSSENTLKDNLEASLSHLYCVDPPFKSGLKESLLSRVFRHHGRSLLAEDSVEEMSENSHLSGHSNLSSNYSQNPIQSSVPRVAQCYKHQLEERSIQSTGSCTGLCSTTLPQAASPMDGNLQTTISDYSLLQLSGIRSYD